MSDLDALSRKVGTYLQARGWQIATAESCTGGWVAKVLTDTPGSSQWFNTGWVTYSNNAKRLQLQVSRGVLLRHGAVSEVTVRAMARKALNLSGAAVAIAVSGIAGPDGGTRLKPVGTVWFAWALRRGSRCFVVARRKKFSGSRDAVRRGAVKFALREVLGLETLIQ